jgi:hypothetical protein
VTYATYQEALEALDDWASDNPLEALREYADYLSPYRLDACATAEPAAALIHAADRLTPERQAWCEAAAGELTYFPDRLEPERRKAIARGGPGMSALPDSVAMYEHLDRWGDLIAKRAIRVAQGGEPPHTRGECDWCLWPLEEVAEEWNGGVGHPECIAWVESMVFGDDLPHPALPKKRFYREDDWIAFLKRLGAAAVRYGIDPHALARAVEDARG